MRTVKQKSKETCENVPRAAIMYKVCVIINSVEEGELKIGKCSAKLSGKKKFLQFIWLPCCCYILYVASFCSLLFFKPNFIFQELAMYRNQLQKEDFCKQNTELELKTRRVLKEVEGMMVGILLLKISFYEIITINVSLTLVFFI